MKMVAQLTVVLGLGLCMTCLSAGCGSGGPEMARVSGKVTYNGTPVTKGLVSYVSSSPDRRNATGAIQSDGTFRLQTENPSDGALLGDYNVIVTAEEATAALDYIPQKAAPKKPLIPEKYAVPDSSGLKKTVVKGSNTHNLDLVD